MTRKGLVFVFMSVFGTFLIYVYSRDLLWLGARECAVYRPTNSSAVIAATATVQSSVISGQWSNQSSLISDQRSDETLSIQDDAAADLGRRVRVMCWIPSVASQLQRKVRAVNDTWVKRCDGHVFFINISTQFPDVALLDAPEGRHHLTAKSMQAFAYLYHHHLRDYDWFLKGDDDAYIVMENLRLLLSQYDPDQPVYLGHLYKMHLKAGYMSGGASYAISREALRRMYEEGISKDKCPKDKGFEDVEVGRCLHAAGVESHSSLDIFGREAFHPLTPDVHIVGPIPSNQIPQDRFLMVAGHNCCSELTVSFHHMSPDLIRIFDFLLYRVTVYGRLPNLAFLDKLFKAQSIPPLP